MSIQGVDEGVYSAHSIGLNKNFTAKNLDLQGAEYLEILPIYSFPNPGAQRTQILGLGPHYQ